jgi:PAS domain S-box-containing protein
MDRVKHSEIRPVADAGGDGSKQLSRRIAELEGQVEALRTSEANLRIVLNSLDDGYWEHDLVTGRLFQSARMNEVIGSPAKDTYGVALDLSARIHPDDLKKGPPIFRQALEGTEDHFDCVFRISHVSGSWKWIRIRGRISATNEEGLPLRYSGTITDIHEGMTARAALMECEARYRDLYDSLVDGVASGDADGHILESNKAFRDMVGYTEEELRGLTFLQITPERWHEIELREVQEHVRHRSSVLTFEKEYRRKDGTVCPVEIRGFIGYTDERTSTMWGIVRDISERKRTEQALATSEAKFREMFHSVPALLWTLRPDGSVTDCNRGWCEFTGMTREQSLGTGWMEALHPSDRATSDAARADALARGSLYQVEQRLRRHDGEYRWFLTRGTPVRDSTGTVVCWQGANVDISERKQAEEALRQAEERNRSILAAMGEGMVLQDASGKIVACNPAAERILGLPHDQMSGRTSVDPLWRAIHEDGSPFPGEDHPAMLTLRTGVRAMGVIMGVHKPDGTLTWISTDAELLRHSATDPPYAVVTTFTDITKARALQAKLTQASRLLSMGTLVAGVGHEINNPLVGVLAGQAVALEAVREVKKRFASYPPGDLDEVLHNVDEAVEALKDAQEGGLRVARIVKDLTTFGRADPKRTRVRLIDVVDGAIRSLAPDLKGGADIAVDDQKAPDVVISLGHMEQAVVNLLANAVQATPKGQRGDVVVRIGPGAPGMARIDVIDHGVGIPPAIKDRLFEPFFTTREVGKGKGLGLSISHAIVTAYGGTIAVESEVGKGSTFQVELPAAPAEA